MSCNCSSVCSLAVALVKGKMSVQGFEGCQALGSPTVQCGSKTVDHQPGVPVLKVYYYRHCSQFAEIDQSSVWTQDLSIRYWVGLCINRNRPLLEGLGTVQTRTQPKGVEWVSWLKRQLKWGLARLSWMIMRCPILWLVLGVDHLLSLCRSFFIYCYTKIKIIFWFNVAVYEEESVSDMSICQVYHHFFWTPVRWQQHAKPWPSLYWLSCFMVPSVSSTLLLLLLLLLLLFIKLICKLRICYDCFYHGLVWVVTLTHTLYTTYTSFRSLLQFLRQWKD